MKLQAAREKSGKTQAQVAMEADVSERMYQSYEYGQNEPGVRTAIRIADALGVTDIRELFAAAPGEEKAPPDYTMTPNRNTTERKKKG